MITPFLGQPFANLVKSAGGVLYLDARKVTGNGLPSNSPLTSQWIDLVGTIGKNIFDPSNIISGFVNPVDGTISPATVGQKSLNYTPVNPNTTYTLSGGDRNAFAFYDTNKNFISGTNISNTVTTPANCAFLRVYYSTNGSHTQVQLEQGSVATSYVPYGKNVADLVNFAGNTSSGYDITNASKPYLKLDGVDDYCSLINTPSVDITSAPLAIGVTVKINSDVTGIIVGKNSSSVADIQYALVYSAIPKAFRFYLNGVVYAETAQITIGNWYSVLAYWDGTSATILVNDTQSGTALSYSGVLPSRNNFAIGRVATSGFYLNGNVANVLIAAGSKATLSNSRKAMLNLSKAYIGA